MNSTIVRLAIAAVFLALTPFGLRFLLSEGQHKVRPPAGDIGKLPMQFGNYRGENVELDPETFVRTGADVVVDRRYRDEMEPARDVSLHLAVFDDPETGVYHAPTNCYRSAGWRLLSEEFVPVPIAGQPDLVVKLTKWERKGEFVLVVFWYRFGDYTVYERFDLGKVRWAMRGQAVWPAMIKVLLQTGAADGFAARTRILDMAKSIHQWLSAWDVAKEQKEPETAGKSTQGAPKTHS